MAALSGSPGSSSNLPGLRISRIAYEGPHSLGGEPFQNSSNLMEIWLQDYPTTGFPGPNILKFYVDGSGNLNENGNTVLGGTLNVSGSTTLNSNLIVGTNATINSLAGSGNSMVVANSIGKLTSESIPTLSLSGSNLTLSNGGSINSTVSIPSGMDNMGNCTATTTLNMASHPITNATAINCSGTVTSGSLSTNTISCFTLNATGSGVSGMNNVTITSLTCTDATFSHDITVNGTVVASDVRFKENVKNLTDIKEQLFKLNPYQYTFKQNQSSSFKFDDNLHFGFIAQEVQKLFPNLTSVIDKDGHLGVKYIEFIPLLLATLKEEDQTIKTQDTRITELQTENTELTTRIAGLENQIAQIQDNLNKQSKSNTTAVQDGLNSGKSTLAQNVPNPFNGETKIAYSIVGNFNQAFIGVYDLNGKELKKIAIQPNSNQITLSAGEFQPGMYMYNLVVDNTLIDSKKMVITQ